MENEIKVLKSDKETFLDRLKDERMKAVVGARLKELEKADNKEKRKRDLATVTKELMESEFVNLDGTSLTISDMMVATATANALKNPRTTFKDLNDAQKVIDNSTETNSGLTINVITNGQDLGDEI